jgi:hypothetical protein
VNDDGPGHLQHLTRAHGHLPEIAGLGLGRSRDENGCDKLGQHDQIRKVKPANERVEIVGER